MSKHCPECGEDTTAKMSKCPSCGSKIGSSRKFGIGCGIFILVIVFFAAIGGEDDKPPTTISTQISSKSEESTATKQQESILAVREKQEISDEEGSNMRQYLFADITEVKTTIPPIGERIEVGSFAYTVHRTAITNSISSNEFLDEKPDGVYFWVQVTVENIDKKARMIPSFNLMDLDGNKYQETPNKIYAEGTFDFLKSLNPKLSKRGAVIFDVPPGEEFNLLVSGGMWSGEKSLISLK